MLMNQFLRPPKDVECNMSLNWKPMDTLERYKKLKIKVPYGPDDITYRFNNKGFRCDDFDSWENHPYRILFAGCSLTEGIGLPLDDCWAKILQNKISNKMNTKIPYWNLADGGTGIDHMIRNLYIEGNSLKPQIIISILPSLERRERWHRDYYGSWFKTQKTAQILLDEKFISYQLEKNFAFLNLLLEKWDSYFLFASYDKSFNSKYMNYSRIKQIDFGLETTDLARDGFHPGPKSNFMFAQKVFQNYWPYIKDKLD